MNQDQLKQMVGEAARDEVLKLPAGQVLGVGTGSTANCFIDALAPHKDHFAGTVSSSNATNTYDLAIWQLQNLIPRCFTHQLL